jgi:hypothetical protein
VLLGVVADGDRTQLIDALARQWKDECDSGKRGSVLTALELALLGTEAGSDAFSYALDR